MDGELFISGKGGRLKALDDFFAGINVQHITTDIIREFKTRRKAEGISGPAINRNLAALRRMFNLARQENKLTTIPYFPMDAESKPAKVSSHRKGLRGCVMRSRRACDHCSLSCTQRAAASVLRLKSSGNGSI